MFRTLRASACAHMCARRVLESGRARACRQASALVPEAGLRFIEIFRQNVGPENSGATLLVTRTALLLLITVQPAPADMRLRFSESGIRRGTKNRVQGLFCFAVPKNRPAVLPIPDSRFRIPENRSLTRKEILKNLLPPLPLPRGIFQNVPDAPCLRLCPHVCATRSGIGQGARLQAGKRSGSRSWPELHRIFSPKCWPGKFWGNFTTRTALLLLIQPAADIPLTHTHQPTQTGSRSAPLSLPATLTWKRGAAAPARVVDTCAAAPNLARWAAWQGPG